MKQLVILLGLLFCAAVLAHAGDAAPATPLSAFKFTIGDIASRQYKIKDGVIKLEKLPRFKQFCGFDSCSIYVDKNRRILKITAEKYPFELDEYQRICKTVKKAYPDYKIFTQGQSQSDREAIFYIPDPKTNRFIKQIHVKIYGPKISLVMEDKNLTEPDSEF